MCICLQFSALEQFPQTALFSKAFSSPQNMITWPPLTAATLHSVFPSNRPGLQQMEDQTSSQSKISKIIHPIV